MAEPRRASARGCHCGIGCAILLAVACCASLLGDAWVRDRSGPADGVRLYSPKAAAGSPGEELVGQGQAQAGVAETQEAGIAETQEAQGDPPADTPPGEDLVDWAQAGVAETQEELQIRAASAQAVAAKTLGEEPAAAPAQPACELAVCGLLGSTRAPRLFLPRPEAPEVEDAAAWLAQIFFGLAASWGARVRFAGVLQGDDMPEGVAKRLPRLPRLVDKLLGAGAAEQLLAIGAPTFSAQPNSTRELLEQVKSLQSSADIGLSAARPDKRDVALWPLFTEDLRAALRRGLDDVPLAFGDAGPTVAIYAHAEGKSKDDSGLFAAYKRPLEEIAKLWPSAQFHVWAGSARRGFWPAGEDRREVPDLKSFGNFKVEDKKMHVQVHLEDVDEEVAWAHLSRAHLLLIAADPTSRVAGVLNQNCVVHPGGEAGLPLGNWISSHADLNVLAAGMVACMRRAAPSFEPAERPEDVEAELATDVFRQDGWMAGGEREKQRGESARFCRLDLCRHGGADAPRIFVAEHGDGAGHRMKNILDGLAVATKNKLNFGGVVPVGNVVTEHGHNFRDLADVFFGVGNADRELFIKPPPSFASAKIDSVQALEAMVARQQLKSDTDYFLPSANDWAYEVRPPFAKYFTPELLDALRQPLSKASLLFAPGRPSVAIHARRGDLKKEDARATPNEYYYALVEHVKWHLPGADVHLFSSLQSYSYEVVTGVRHWTSADFDGFRERGVHVHLDGESLLVPWLHMARADVFIMSKSSFSYVAAVINPNCVIHAGADHPFPAWLDGNLEVKASGKDSDKNQKLLKCLARTITRVEVEAVGAAFR